MTTIEKLAALKAQYPRVQANTNPDGDWVIITIQAATDHSFRHPTFHLSTRTQSAMTLTAAIDAAYSILISPDRQRISELERQLADLDELLDDWSESGGIQLGQIIEMKRQLAEVTAERDALIAQMNPGHEYGVVFINPITKREQFAFRSDPDIPGNIVTSVRGQKLSSMSQEDWEARMKWSAELLANPFIPDPLTTPDTTEETVSDE